MVDTVDNAQGLLVQLQKPVRLAAFAFHSICVFVVCRFDLGTACPLVNNVIAGQGPDPGAEDVFLEMDVQWVAKGSDVELKVNPLPTFITKIPGLKSLTSFTVSSRKRHNARDVPSRNT